MKITADMLRKLNACDPGIAAFRARFPDGATWDEVTTWLVETAQPTWAAWLGVFCPANIPGATWSARVALQATARHRYWLAKYCPEGIPGESQEDKKNFIEEDK